MVTRVPITETITAITEGAANTVLTVATIDAPEGFVAVRSINLTGITVTGILAPGSGAQVHVGILKNGDSVWNGDIISPQIDGGEFATWAGNLRLEEGDAVQAYASVANRIDITLETEDI